MTEADTRCMDRDCVCQGAGNLIWVIDYHRWRHQLLCNMGGTIFLEVEDDFEIYDYVGEAPGFKGNPARGCPPLPTADDYFRCLLCNRLVLRMGRRQKYCPHCAAEAHKAVKRKWIRAKREQNEKDNGRKML